MRTMLRSHHYEREQGVDPLERAYGWFLELPPAVVLSALWLAGLTLVGSCVLVFYLYVSLLARV